MLTYHTTTITSGAQMDGTEEWDYIRFSPPMTADTEIFLPAITTSNVGRRYTLRHVATWGVTNVYPAGGDLIEGNEDYVLGHGRRMTIQSFAFDSGWRWEIVAD